jgi:hypothetical protein
MNLLQKIARGWWDEYYRYGWLYSICGWFFPVTGRSKTFYCGEERTFRPVWWAIRAWHRGQLLLSCYRVFRKYRHMGHKRAMIEGWGYFRRTIS